MGCVAGQAGRVRAYNAVQVPQHAIARELLSSDIDFPIVVPRCE